MPARMCTVSHCHKILPGFYRYKRCEQHRIQNRQHSKVKKVREQDVKAAEPSYIHSDLGGQSESGKNRENGSMDRDQTNCKGKGKAIEEKTWDNSINQDSTSLASSPLDDRAEVRTCVSMYFAFC